MPDRVSRKTRRTFFGFMMLAAGLALSGSTAHAMPFEFNPFGAGGGDGTWPREVAGLDFSVGNVLAKDGVAAFAAGNGATFQLYYQATLAGAIPTVSGGTTIVPTGLNSQGTGGGFEITVVASITQMVTSPPGASVVTFQAVPTANQSPNSFFQMFYDPTPNASNTAGTGFTDGDLILSAKPLGGGAGNFSKTGQNGSTVIGNGGTKFFSNVLFADSRFFTGDIPDIEFNGINVVPSSSQQAAALTGMLGGLPVSIPVNSGSINGVSGPDVILEMDAFITAVPEPSSLVLSGLGLLGLLAVRRRRAHTS